MTTAVIGAGSWGSAVALHLGRKNIPTRLWVREADVFDTAVRYRENRTFLPGSIFPAAVDFHNNLEDAVRGVEIIFVAVPSQHCRALYSRLFDVISPEQIIVSLTKGIEQESLKRMSEILEEIFFPRFQPRIASLSGPSFAREVAESHPTAVVVASRDLALAQEVQGVLSNPYFRTYASDDIVGVEIAGSLKNVIAIAAGISDGLDFGSNTLAALITRGIAEMSRLGMKLGARRETFSGLAGIGDLVLTCTGKLSRNRYVGYELGQGKSLDSILSGMTMIAEGIATTKSCRQLSLREGIEMPIAEQVYRILYENKDPRKALENLMSRKLKIEHSND